jgi:hypothetical protein
MKKDNSVKLGRNLSNWVIVPMVVSIVGIGGSVFAWVSLGQAEQRAVEAESALTISEGSYERRLEQFYDANAESVTLNQNRANCELILGPSECGVYGTLIVVNDEWLREATDLLALSVNGVRDARLEIKDASSRIETWRFTSGAIIVLTVLALLSIIAVAVIPKRRD